VNERVLARVTGTVQGVGFRFFACRTAVELGLVGWVRNLADGSVEFVAEGPREQLERLCRLVEAGPPGSAVRDIEVRWAAAEGSFRDFGVRS
jgi:acylphosphatase